jgi:hypothetical protein
MTAGPLHFNFVLANHAPARLQELDDVLRPIFFGLRAAGHRVTAAGRRFQAAPAVNIVTDDLTPMPAAQLVAEARSAWGDGLRFGVLAVSASPPAEVLHAASFAWTLAANPAIDASVPPARRAVIGYGFAGALQGPRLIADPGQRDLDVAVYGAAGERLDRVMAGLSAAGLGAFAVRAGALPDYLVTDLLSRAKVVVAVDNSRDSQAQAPRVLKAICNGVLVIAERPAGAADPFWSLVEDAREPDLPAACRRLIAAGDYAARGLAALERLRQTCPMRDALAEAVACAAAAGRS